MEIDRNQMMDAEANPPTKNRSVPAGSVALKAPSIMLPSMRACGLNHVTTQAVVTTLAIGIFTSLPVSRDSSFDLRRPMPIHMTMRLPTSRTAISSQTEACISAPIPKKHASPRVTSKKITMSAVA